MWWRGKNISFFLLVTWDCNLSCPWCYVNPSPPGKCGSVEDKVVEALFQLFENDSPTSLILYLTGGEPLLYPSKIVLINNLFTSFPFLKWVRVLTNGTLLDLQMGKYLIGNDVRHFAISMGRNIEIDQKLCSILPSLRDLSAVILLIVTTRNLDYIEQLLDEILVLPHEYIIIRPIMNEQWDQVSLEKYHSVMERLGQKLAQYTLRTGKVWFKERLGEPISGLNPVVHCPFLNSEMELLPVVCAPSGELFPCLRLATRDQRANQVNQLGCMGNILKGRSSFQRIKRDIISLQDFPCNTCPLQGFQFRHDLCPILYKQLVVQQGRTQAKAILCNLHYGMLYLVRSYLRSLGKDPDRYLQYVQTCGQYDCKYHFNILDCQLRDHMEVIKERCRILYEQEDKLE